MLNRSGRVARRSIAAAACVVLTAALLGACTPAPASAGAPLDRVDPALTDPDLPSEPGHPQFSIPPGAPAKNRLVVLFHGTGGTPTSLTKVGRALAADGHHVVSLRYEASVGTLDACPSSVVLLDPDCHRRLRSEVVFGAGVGPTPTTQGYDHLMANVTATTSIVNRLLAYVDYLAVNRPGQGWEQFQHRNGQGECSAQNPTHERCELRWDQLVAMGYSQGAGVALYLGKFLTLDRVGMLAGSFDAFGSAGSYVAAPWLSEPFATDKARISVLIHPQDAHAGRQRTVAGAVGLTDAEVDVTKVAAPYGNSRRLITTAQPQCVNPEPTWAHTAPVGGGCTIEGLHDRSWAYMAGGS
jgi:hypothetical protein